MQALQQLYAEAQQARLEQGGLQRALMLFETIAQQAPDTELGRQAGEHMAAIRHQLQHSAFPLWHQQPVSLILLRAVFGVLIEIILPLVLLILYFNADPGWQQTLLGAATLGMLAWLAFRSMRTLYVRTHRVNADWPGLSGTAKIGRAISLTLATLLLVYFLTAIGLLLRRIFI